MKNNTIESQLLQTQVAIENALSSPALTEALSAYGYDENKLLAGQALYNQAQQAQEQQKKEYGEQFAATDALVEAYTEGFAQYMKHVQVARVALKDQRGVFEELQINGRRKRTYSGWLQQGKAFYGNALANQAVKDSLASFGIDEAALNNGLSAMETFEQRLAEQLKEKGEAQEATQIRDANLDALLDWFSDFVKIARIALAGNPQRLEMLGVVAGN